MSTPHPNIETLELYALRRSGLAPEKALSIMDHLKTCAYCSDLLDEIDDLMRETALVDESLIARETARIMRMASSGTPLARNETILYFMPTADHATSNGGFALAAKSEETQVDFRPIATLYSDDGHTLLRILHERENTSYFFQLMSEHNDHIPYTLLIAPGKEPLMTNAEGALRIADSELDIVQIVSMSVYYALDRMRAGAVEPYELASHEGVLLASEDSTLHLRKEGEGIGAVVRWHGAGQTPPRFLGVASRDSFTVGVLKEDSTVLPLTSLPEDAIILLY
ncbi:MAG: hypothetical protein IH600_02315 [Bacteroidetes bacterium]|nr:hypothetical protein [Bacteroidota bacterium]